MKIRSLRTKITIPIVIVILITGFCIIVVEQTLLEETFTRALLDRGIADTKHLAAASVDAILAGDDQFLQNLVEEKKRTSSDIMYVFIADNKSNILAHTFSEGFPLHLLWINSVDSSEETSTEILETEEEQ